MQQAQATEAAGAGEGTAQLGDGDAVGVADDDVRYGTPPIDEHADLAADLLRQLGQVARQLRRHDLVRRQAASVQVLKGASLRRLEAAEVSVEGFDGADLRGCRRGTNLTPPEDPGNGLYSAFSNP